MNFQHTFWGLALRGAGSVPKMNLRGQPLRIYGIYGASP